MFQAYRDTQDEIWLEYAVSCFLQGIKFGVSNSRSHLARVLYLLSFDTPSESVGRAFDKYLDQIPHWVWLSWIPQLLLSLQRTEAPHCKLVLLKIATVFPQVDVVPCSKDCYQICYAIFYVNLDFLPSKILQALYYWLRTYLLERRDVANKSELGRLAMAQQRMQQNASGAGAASLGLTDGNARVQSHGGGGALATDNTVHQGTQSSGGIGSHDGGNTHGHEPERSTAVESSVHAGNDQTLQQSSSMISESGQNAVRRNVALGFVASAASAFEAAKEIMEALRSKHSNLASELEVMIVMLDFLLQLCFYYIPHKTLIHVMTEYLPPHGKGEIIRNQVLYF